MPDRAMIDLPPLEFPYGVIERTLAAAYGIPDVRRAVGFRGMLSNLQKLGVLGPQSRVGRGAPLTYTPNEFERLVLTMEFCEFGLPPAAAVGLVGRYWDGTLKAIVFAAGDSLALADPPPRGKDTILYVGGLALRTSSLRGEKPPIAPVIEHCTLDDLPDAMKRWMQTTPPRGLIVNLSERLRAFHGTLVVIDAEWLADHAPARKAADKPAKPDETRISARP
jgi:hypothetical protein